MPWTDGVPSLYYEITGSGDRRLVLIHEMGGSLESWRAAAGLLGDVFQILSYDQRGAGLSEKPPGSIDPADHIDDLEQVVAAAGWGAERVAIAGASAGSAIAIGYALRHAQLVDGLVLCVPSVESSPQQLAGARERAEKVATEGMRALVDGAMAATYPESIRDGRFHEYRARWLAHDPRAFAELNLAFTRVDLDLDSIQAPCLVLAGEQDATRPPEAAAAVAARIPGARSEGVPGAAHVMAVQAPEEVATRLMAFFKKSQP